MKLIHELLFRSAQRWPQAVALRLADQTWTFTQLANASSWIDSQLQQRGVRPGDRIVTLFDKSFAGIAAMFGVWATGGVAVNLNSKLPPSMLGEVIADCDPRLIMASESLRPSLPQTCAQVLAVNDAIPMNVPVPPGTAGFARESGDLAAIIYTSGSTGRQKGVMLSHANLLHHVSAVTQYLGNTPDDRIISVLPLYFGYGLSQVLTSVGVGAALSLVDSFVYPQQVIDVLESHRITGMAGVPSHFQMLLSHGGLASRKLPSLRYITISGSSSSPDLVRELRRALPSVQIYLMFGQTESCIRSCYLPPDEIDRRPTSIGRAIPGVRTMLVDDHGRELHGEAVGELVCAGPNVMLGYWNDPALTNVALRSVAGGDERVLFTGDLVRRDEQGFLYFLGRKDEMIKSGAHRIFPLEIERVLLQCPGVGEAAVVGTDDGSLGQLVIAHVAPAKGAECESRAVLEHCRRNLPAYMVPRKVIVHQSLPRTSTGKVRKMDLVDSPSQEPDA